jgi:universal stress protein E
MRAHRRLRVACVRHAGIAGILIGNTAVTILNRIDCSVLAIKPEGFFTPVTI